jgi:hypothetical protein
MVTPEAVARALAPLINLHPKDPHQPCSVEWFLGRTDVVSGSATLPETGPVDLPQGLRVTTPAPLTSATLASASSSSAFGGGEIDDISLFPITQDPGSDEPPATPSWSDPALVKGYFTNIFETESVPPPPLSSPYFYDYQQETFLGQQVAPSRTGASTVPLYCRIASRWDYYLISYFGFFAYNGGLGHSPPTPPSP